jgi:hypothetical protein
MGLPQQKSERDSTKTAFLTSPFRNLISTVKSHPDGMESTPWPALPFN